MRIHFMKPDLSKFSSVMNPFHKNAIGPSNPLVLVLWCFMSGNLCKDGLSRDQLLPALQNVLKLGLYGWKKDSYLGWS